MRAVNGLRAKIPLALAGRFSAEHGIPSNAGRNVLFEDEDDDEDD
jgi:hypothetical protein